MDTFSDGDAVFESWTTQIYPCGVSQTRFGEVVVPNLLCDFQTEKCIQGSTSLSAEVSIGLIIKKVSFSKQNMFRVASVALPCRKKVPITVAKQISIVLGPVPSATRSVSVYLLCKNTATAPTCTPTKCVAADFYVTAPSLSVRDLQALKR
jgi:hypothetical protein